MKRSAVIFGILVLLCTAVFSASEQSDAGEMRVELQTGQGTGGGEQANNETQTRNAGAETNSSAQIREQIKNQTQDLRDDAQQLKNQTRDQIKNQTQDLKDDAQQLRNQTRDQIRNISAEVKAVRTELQEQTRLLNQEAQASGSGKEGIYVNQNKVRAAVHALLGMENLSGGIGPQISAVAREFNNSVQATIRTEERIQERSGFVRFLFGGDEQAAGELQQEVIRNQERIQTLTQYMNECDCDPEVKALLQEQIQEMQQEQNRLQTLAQNEQQDKGILGWLFK